MSTLSRHIKSIPVCIDYEDCLEKFQSNYHLSTVHRHLRLELLEGVVAYHSGQFDKSRKVLTSAQAKLIQVS